MFKRITIFSTFLLSAVLFAASSYTPHFNLELPADGDSAWGDAIRSNFTEVDEQMYINEQATADHIADTTGAHAATAISATGGATLCTDSDDVQEYLDCLEGNVGPIIGGTVVTVSGAQTITGEKTFSTTPIFSDLSTGLLHSDASGNLSSSLLVDDDVSASASIARSKLSTGTNYRILANSSAGVMSENAALTSGHVIIADANGQLAGEATLANTRGGLGTDASAFTGLLKASSGTFSASTLVNADVNASAAIALSKLAATTASRALVSDGSGFVSPATTTATEIGYVNGVTSAIQTQLDGKQATGNYVTALTGDVTASGPGSVAATIANNAVSNAKLAQMATLTIKGNDGGGTADPQDLSVAEVNLMLGSLSNPMDSAGDMIYGGASGTPTKLDSGTLGQVLVSGGAAAPTWNFNGGTVVTITNADSPYTPALNVRTILANATSGAITINIPAASNSNYVLDVIKTDTSANLVTLDPNSSETVCGQATVAMSGLRDAFRAVSNGTNIDSPNCRRTIVATLNCDSSSALVDNPNAAITSIGNITGTPSACAVTLVTGVFSTNPVCVGSESNGGSTMRDVRVVDDSATATPIYCREAGSTTSATTVQNCTAFNAKISCQGAR